MTLYSIAYLPPIAYFSSLMKEEKIVFEKHEHFVKQTFRNRTLIYGPGGTQQLIIPVRHEELYRKPIHEIEISRGSPWQRIHWRTITSAYRSSAFFEFYEDDFRRLYEAPATNIFDFNLVLIQTVFSLLRISFAPEFTTQYEKNPVEASDLRNEFTYDVNNTTIPEYRQVFSSKHGFIPNLSVIDLLFNLGPEAKTYLHSIPPLKA